MRHRTLFTVLAGSRGRGVHTPDSDYDFRSVYLYNADADWRMTTPADQINGTLSDDHVMYEYRKFVRMCVNGSPEAVEMLFLPLEEELGEQSPEACIYEALQRNRHVFCTESLAKKLLAAAGWFAPGETPQKGCLWATAMKLEEQGEEKRTESLKHYADAFRRMYTSLNLLLGQGFGMNPRQREYVKSVKMGLAQDDYQEKRDNLYHMVVGKLDANMLPDSPDEEVVKFLFMLGMEFSRVV